ncbi:MAG TPA: DnaB-like helicase C-terminal domain-containing protein [Acidimicrobiia bacterium]|nr:DnaB-like helicase C-terminal domain-containing protein [Acidimicrobiia bacterium]
MKVKTENVSTLLEAITTEPVAPERRERAFVTGFSPLDDVLGGGLRSQDLTLVGGKPGVGKTIGTLQWARNMVLDGATVIYACYEHTPRHLLSRLLLNELGALARQESLVEYDGLRSAIADFAWGYRTLDELPDRRGLIADAVACVRSYADRLWLTSASASRTDLAELEALVVRHGTDRTALFVDYLQKVPVGDDTQSEGERMTRVAGALKDLALTRDATVVAVAASTQAGLESHRQRLHHLRGSTALAYEADRVLMMNQKVDAVSKVHLAYDGVRAEQYQHVVVVSIEKNRSGPAGIDLEFRKDFTHARFDPNGGWVTERLVDDRIVVE